MKPQHFHCTLELDGVDPDALRVTSFELTESLSAPYRVRVQATAQEALDASPLGKKGVLAVNVAGEVLRRWHGVVFECSAEGGPQGAQVTLVLVPRLERLRLGSNLRLFQDQTAQDIVKTLLKEGEIPDAAQEWKLAATPAKRPYTVQYGESDLDFIERLLSEEGIGYALKNSEDQEIVHFFDDSTQLPDIDGERALVDRHSTDYDQDTLEGLAECRVGASDAMASRDYDFQRPGFDASNQKAAPRSTQREVYVHPLPLAGTPEGKQRLERGLERLQMPVKTVRAQSNCPRLEAGRVFEAQGSKRQALNAEYVITSVSHTGALGDGSSGPDDGLAYRNELRALPKAIPTRPPLIPAPIPVGIEVAYVTCPPGEELHSDKWGRVKARFPWDRSGTKDDKSSTWLRVGQPPMQGSMVLPRGTFEVTIDFERGNVDTPFVSGHIYNEEAPPPYALPGGKTRSSYQTATTHGGAGANEMRFEDAAGSEEIFFNASKDYLASVDNNASLDVTQHKTTKIGSNAELKVGDTHDHQVTGNRKLDVGAAQEINVEQDFTETMGAALNLNVSAVRKHQVGGNLAASVKSTLDRKVNGLLSVTTIRGYNRNVTGDSVTKVGAAWMELVGGNRLSSVNGLRKEAVGGVKLVKAQSVSVSCGDAYAATAASENAKVKGGWTDTATGVATLSAAAGMSIKAKTVTFEGKSSLTVRAGTVSIKLSSSGTVEISASNVDLRGMDALTQINHGSN